MPRIPRTEQTVGFQPAMMPGTSGDAYAAPGRAMQGLGNAIAGLGASLDAKAEQENDYGDKLRMLKWSNEVDLEELKRRSNYNGDGTNYTADTQNWYKEREASLYDGLSPKGKQKAALFIEGKRGTVVEGAQRFETEKRNQTMFSSTEAAITSEFGKLAELPPDQFESASITALKGINGIIDQNPLGEPAKERLREHARQLYEAAILKALPEGSRAQSAKRLMEQWQKTLPTEPAPAPGPQSSLSGNIGSVSAKYESGGRGVGFVSTGHKDPGGPSYGIHQLSSKDSMPAFLRSPEGQKYAAEFKGRSAGSAEFNAIYKKVAAADPQGFADAQYGYYSRTHFKPVLEHARALGYDVEDRGVQEALFSISVQHGGAKKIVSGAKAAAVGKDPAAQVVALFERRADYVGGVALPAETKASVLNRYRSEVKDALKYAGQKVTTGSGEVKVASLGGTVPAGADVEQPAPSKITETLKGTPEEKAAKLRELMSKGYQDVVHQLDNDGNDVIIAKKSSKPVWQRGVRGKNEDGTIPNELDRPDFAGPGWANGVVEDVKAGKLRPTNTIPGETKVAEAPTPATRYRPSVETKLMESLQKKLPALRAQDEAAVGKLVARAEDVAGKGVILPPDERRAVEAAILATGSKELADRYTRANLAAAETYMLKGARPDRIRDVAIGMRAEIAKAGGEATPEHLAKAEAVEKLAKHVDTELDTDMLGWGQEIGVIPHLPALDPARPDPESLKAYAEAATYMAARYGRQPQVFSKLQAEAVAERFKAGGPQMLDMLGRYATGLGPPMMAQAMRQIAPHAPEGAIAGYLYGNNINQAAAKDIAETLHRRKDPNYKGSDVRRADSEPTAEIVLGDAFRTYPPEQRDAILKAADAIYENRVKGGKAAGYQAKDYEKAVRDVIGERTDAKGNVYGGAVSQSASTLGMFGKKAFVMIPPTWRQDTLKTTLETVSAEDLKAAGLPPPVTADGKPVSAVRLANKGKLVPVGNGLGTYAVAMGDPETPGKEDYLMAAPANPRDDRQTLPRTPFVIDLTKLEPVLRKRLPSAFWAD